METCIFLALFWAHVSNVCTGWQVLWIVGQIGKAFNRRPGFFTWFFREISIKLDFLLVFPDWKTGKKQSVIRRIHGTGISTYICFMFLYVFMLHSGSYGYRVEICWKHEAICDMNTYFFQQIQASIDQVTFSYMTWCRPVTAGSQKLTVPNHPTKNIKT